MPKEAFLLEIGTEEIPARFLTPALTQLAEAAAQKLQGARLTYDKIKTFGTPRRLALLVEGLADRQEDLQEKKKGPAVKAAYDAAGNPTKAAVGFARAQGVEVSDLYTEELDGVPYVFALRTEKGMDTLALLPELCGQLIRSLSFPKPMFWYSKEIRFARPIRWLAALYGDTPVTFSFAGLEAQAQTYGHRFLAPGPHPIPHAAAYPEVMRSLYVLVDPEERKAAIVAQVEAAAAAEEGYSVLDPDLLEEVVNLVEYPGVVTGHFDPAYLNIPQEVLITAMRTHQRYFPVFGGDGRLLPAFIAITNGTKQEYTCNVRAGNERVLKARLADARFFFDEDRKKPLSAYVAELEQIVFLEQLGTMRDKTDRLVRLCEALAAELQVAADVKAAAKRAAYLAKADLLTHMVYEFPELQGTMGMHYALLSGENEAVARAIHEHYMPRFAGDEPAATLPGAIVAIADKMDTLAACFSLGMIPTGSQDPYALRRNASGVVATLAAHRLPLTLQKLCVLAVEGLPDNGREAAAAVVSQLAEFLLQRVRHYFSEQGLRYDVIDAVLTGSDLDLPGLLARARTLQAKLDTPELIMLLTPYTRAANLTRNAQPGVPDPALFVAEAEQALYDAALQARQAVEANVSAGNFEAVFAALAPLYTHIARFFDEVMVMTDDAGLRANRLALLQLVKELFLPLGDISKIVQEKK
ncbi:MAG: glycine--tRNA ligase subunit beta [Firmicutes bacterium]|nr:glycine--tRNA ligase subunit beta [Bacillota bacterium]